MRRIRPADLVGTTPVWCLDLHHGGTTYRVASEPIDVKADDGTMLSYAGGLEPVAFEEQLGRLKFTAPDLSATIRAILPVSVAKLGARGHDWLGATADLYLTVCRTADRGLTVPVSDLTHGEMWLQVSGRVRSPTWGDPSAPPGLVEFTLRVAPWDATDPTINDLGTITASRFPAADEDVYGKRLPLIIGHPGVYIDKAGVEQYGGGSPGYVTARTGPNADTLVAAGHGIPKPGTVEVLDEAGNVATASAFSLQDGDGNDVVLVDISSAALPFQRSNTEFWIAWSSAGGIAADATTGPAEEAPDVAALLLARAGFRLDYPAWSALKGRIATVKVAGYVNDDATAWDYVSRHVLPLMPVAYRYTRQGLAPVVYDPAYRSGDTVAHVRTIDVPDAESSGDWTPTGPVALETEPEDVPARLDVTMATDGRTGTQPRDLSWVGTGAGPVPRYLGLRGKAKGRGSLYIQQASTRGATGTQSLELSQVWDVPTLDAVAGWRLRLGAMPTLSASYDAPLHWGWLQVGDSLTVTDPLREFDGAIGVIDGKRLTRNGWEFVLVFTEDPVRDARVLD